MIAITQDMRTMWAVAQFFTMVYLTYILMYVAPTDQLRRWGERAWWQRFRLGPVWPK
ncbi:MAG: hypothetical protein ACYC4L_08895 [Chloroflexota bacterium]